MESVETMPTCPCPKVTCPRHGKCSKCISHHLKRKNPNCCSFYAVLPILEEAIKQSPDTSTAKYLVEFIDRRKERYLQHCVERQTEIRSNCGLFSAVFSSIAAL